MPRSRRAAHQLLLLALCATSPAWAQQQAQGYGVERFYPSAPGAGWFVMDDLNIHGGLGGALALTLGYAQDPLVVRGAGGPLAVVSNEAAIDFAGAVTYDRWRFSIAFRSPLIIRGHSGVVGDSAFTGPMLDPGSNPDTLSDVRIGTEVRIFGESGGHFRLGASAQLFVPSGSRADYVTDSTFRAMAHALVAGDTACFSYAANAGVHIRPFDDSPTPGSPNGSELLFGVAAGAKLPIGHTGRWVAVVGPEVFGATALRSLFLPSTTALEGLLTGRLEGTSDAGVQVRVKLGFGAGLIHAFGAPEWRVVAGIEIFNHNQPQSPQPPKATEDEEAQP